MRRADAAGRGGRKASTKSRKKSKAWRKQSSLLDYENFQFEETNDVEDREEGKRREKEQEWETLQATLKLDKVEHVAMLKEFWEDLRSSSKAEEESAHEEEGSKRLTPDVTRRVEELVQLIPMASKDSTLFKLLAELRRILQTDSHKFVSAYLRLKFFSDMKVLQRLSQAFVKGLEEKEESELLSSPIRRIIPTDSKAELIHLFYILSTDRSIALLLSETPEVLDTLAYILSSKTFKEDVMHLAHTIFCRLRAAKDRMWERTAIRSSNLSTLHSLELHVLDRAAPRQAHKVGGAAISRPLERGAAAAQRQSKAAFLPSRT